MPFDETLTPGQPGHVTTHQAIAARLNQLSDAALGALFVAKSGTTINVPAPTGNATTDTAAIQAALSAVPSTGAIVRIPAGVYDITAAGLTCSNPVLITGAPGLNGKGTHLSGSAATGAMLTLTADNVIVENIVLSHGGARSAGLIGLRIDGADSIHLHRVRIESFWTNLVIEEAAGYDITECWFRDYASEAIDLSNTVNPDAGDGVITGCRFDSSPTYSGTTAILWHSGGGLRVVNNKILGGSLQHGDVIKLNMADGGTPTGVLIVANNSIEHFTGRAVYLGRAGTLGFFANTVIITGNEFAPYNNTASTGVEIDMEVGGVTITGNHFYGCTTLMYLKKCQHVTVDGNVGTSTKTTGIRLGATVKNCHIGRQAFDMEAGGKALVHDDPTYMSDPQWETSLMYRDITTTTAVDIARIGVNPYARVIVDIEVFGVNQGYGAYWVRATRLLSSTNAGDDLTIQTVGTDNWDGDFTVNHIVTGQAGFYKVSIAKPASGSNASGSIRVKVRGNGLTSFEQILRDHG